MGALRQAQGKLRSIASINEGYQQKCWQSFPCWVRSLLIVQTRGRRHDGALMFHRRRSLALMAALVLNWSGWLVAQEKPWLEVRSPHFRVITNGSDRDARHVARAFEQMRAVFSSQFRLHAGGAGASAGAGGARRIYDENVAAANVQGGRGLASRRTL